MALRANAKPAIGLILDLNLRDAWENEAPRLCVQIRRLISRTTVTGPTRLTNHGEAVNPRAVERNPKLFAVGPLWTTSGGENNVEKT